MPTNRSIARRRPAPAAPSEDAPGGFIRRPSIGALAALLGVLGTIITGIIGYHDTQTKADAANAKADVLRADIEKERDARRDEFQAYTATLAADRDKFRTSVSSELEKFKTAAAADVEKFRIEQRAAVDRARSDNLLELGKIAGRVDKLDERITGVDNSGTAYGRSAFSSQNIDRANTKKQLDDTQATVASLVPVVARIEAKLDAWTNPAPAPPSRRSLSAR